MNKCVFLLLIFLISCNQTNVKTLELITSTPPVNSSDPTATRPFPTKTQNPTITSQSNLITELPQIVNTPVSNFNNTKTRVFTPSPPQECPPKNSTKITLPEPLPNTETDFQKNILEILNKGGLNQLLNYLSVNTQVAFQYEDLTNDGVRELVIISPTYGGYLNVFGCKNKEFVKLLTVTPAYEYSPNILAIKDINRDGVNELVVDLLSCHYCTGIMVYQWNGEEFAGLVRDWYYDYDKKALTYSTIVEMLGYAQASIADTDHNGTYELILNGGIPSYLGGLAGGDGPYRSQEVVFMWNGQYYVWYSQEFSPPNFRFEAVQDGDNQTLRGSYDIALKSYQAAIFDDKLKSWDRETWYKLVNEATKIEYPDIQKMRFDQTEYDQLSAYARYRILIMYLARDWESDAKIVYKTLTEKYPQGNSGYRYVEMAAEFWNEYQLSQDLAKSCAKVITYTELHVEVLDPLGSHGVFDEYYKPESVCPFK